MPPDDTPENNALEGDLHTLTNEEWLAAHQALIASGAIPAEELRFLYDPSRDPATVVPDELLYGGGLDLA